MRRADPRSAFVASFDNKLARELTEIVLTNRHVTIRELRASDARSLFELLTTDDVTRLMSAPPSTFEGFERFISWTRRERTSGSSLTLGIVPRGEAGAVGLIQIRARDPQWDVAEWGFALGSPYWGSGLFMAAATTTVAFTFGVLGVNRLEARSAVSNGRGIGALRKLGALEEGILRQSLPLGSTCLDQSLWTLLEPAA